jgi:hypothetical protein
MIEHAGFDLGATQAPMTSMLSTSTTRLATRNCVASDGRRGSLRGIDLRGASMASGTSTDVGDG